MGTNDAYKTLIIKLVLIVLVPLLISCNSKKKHVFFSIDNQSIFEEYKNVTIYNDSMIIFKGYIKNYNVGCMVSTHFEFDSYEDSLFLEIESDSASLKYRTRVVDSMGVAISYHNFYDMKFIPVNDIEAGGIGLRIDSTKIGPSFTIRIN